MWKSFKCRDYILTNGGGKKCLKLHKYTLKLYIYAVWVVGHGSAHLLTKYLELHPNSCNFASWNLWLFILKSVTLNFKSCHFALLPPLVFLEAKSPTFFFLILNELHSAAENFTFLTKTNYIPYENTLHSLREYTSFS